MNNTAYETALRIILVRAHAEGELADKLRKKHFADQEIQETLDQLRAEKYINDAKLAREYVQWHLDYKPMGKRGIVQRLRLRKFKEADIEAAVRELVTPEVVAEGAKRLIELRLARTDLKSLSPDKRRERLARFLLSRGFDTDLVLSLIDQKTTVTK